MILKLSLRTALLQVGEDYGSNGMNERRFSVFGRGPS